MNQDCRCITEIPQSSNPAACDALRCNALADLLCEEGFMCASCFKTYGGTPIITVELLMAGNRMANLLAEFAKNSRMDNAWMSWEELTGGVRAER